MKTMLIRISLFSLLFALISANSVNIGDNAAATTEVVPEGRDFASQVLRDPWDMSEYSDVSAFINGDGEVINLNNITTNDGLFSAHSLVADNWFYVLFAGYQTALMTGKIGHNYPIQSATFHCFSMAMTANQAGTRKMSVWWSDDDILGSGQWGVSAWYDVANHWKLYQIDLANSYAGNPADPNSTPWNNRSTWQNLYIRPFLEADVTFSVDWVRLTDCNPVYKTINWSGSGPVSIYLQPSGTTRQIEVQTGITGNSYNLDVQGVAPGEYTYYVKNGSSTLASGVFNINSAPIAQFTNPSYSSGQDYATAAGNAWDMDRSDDVDNIACASGIFLNGLLNLITPAIQQQPSGCNANNISDPQIWLSYSNLVDTSQYRYLTFRMNTEGPWADVSNAMIVRWVWTINNDDCGMVTNDIPFDVGWQTITIDLGNPEFGVAEDWTGKCPAAPLYWAANPAKRMRLDPNENTLSSPMSQMIDYVLLTKMSSTKVGSIFPIQVAFNKSANQITSASYYYTTTLTQPTQQSANRYVPSLGPFKIYLPLIIGGFGVSYDPNSLTFAWDTSGVAAGTYYICGVFNDGFNNALYCSDAPVRLDP
jgi:hypothetical protein